MAEVDDAVTIGVGGRLVKNLDGFAVEKLAEVLG
jgi:hypothetical protein